ncbi:KdsC family phosphatase [Nitrosopumilus ureiphilus]|uniref:KdsC family phosphatase n=1 Tax=Nitrosopumilus ureiphilus TaxID=1470067 RepID=UPI001FE463A4|nr:HAD hydrolase family protein [Nitrosopumilus ureiphilus]
MTDVDCVLTDCGMYYDKTGDVMKKFHTRDGMGVTLLRKNMIPTIIVTKEKTVMVRKWAKNMKIFRIFDGIQDKEQILIKICNTLNVKPEQIAYIGDDINDIGLLNKVGFSTVPKNAIDEAKKIANYVCKTEGGHGVLREVADLILTTQGLNVNFTKK